MTRKLASIQKVVGTAPIGGVVFKSTSRDFSFKAISNSYLLKQKQENNMITKFTDSDNNICYMQYVELTDYFLVWLEDLSEAVHTFLPDEVEDYLDRGVWKRLS